MPNLARFIASVAMCLPELSSDVMQGWIENPKALKKFLSGLCPPAASPKLKIWKTIKLGTLKTVDDFREALKANGMRIGDWANDILGKCEFSAETEVDLVRVTVADLGFKNGATREQIYARAKERGLELCPPEVGPQLRLQYKDQPEGEWLLIGMEPIRGSDGGLLVFCVERPAFELWLGGFYGSPDNVWDAVPQWVFVRPRK